MVSRSQRKVGIPSKRRGQQMGDARSPVSPQKEAVEKTPAIRGRLKKSSEMFGDDSMQNVASGATAPSSNSPSTPAAIPSDQPMGESGGERAFNRRLAKRESGQRKNRTRKR